MPLFVLTCIDKPNALATRMAAREEHLAYLAAAPGVKLAGPFLDDAGGPTGSMLIIEADDLAQAKAFSAADPYARAGLFQSVDVRPYRVTIGEL